MQVLTIQENGILLRLLFNCDSKSFSAIRSDFASAFQQQQDRLRACCAALLLLEDSRALNTAQRLGTWYTLHAGWDQGLVGSAPNPFLAYLVEVAGDVRRSIVERHLVLQLLQSYQLPQLDGRTPLDYAMSYSLPLTCTPGDLIKMRLQIAPELAPAPGTDLDHALQAMKKHLVALAAAHAPPQPTSSTHPRPNTASAASAPVVTSSIGSVASDRSSSLPTTPARLPPGIPIKAAAGTPSPPGAGPMSHPLIGDLNGGAAGGTGGGLGGHDWTVADGSSSEARASSSGGGGVSGPLPAWLVPVRELLDKALQGPLMPAQQSVVFEALAKDPLVVSQLGLGPSQLPALVEHVPSIAVDLLSRLSGSPTLLDYLAMLAHSEMSLHSMEVVNRLTTCMELPTEFLHLYIANCIHSCEATADKYVQSRLVRLLCVFLQSLIRNRIVNIADLLHEVQSFCVNFSRIREAAKLFRLLKQLEAGGRLGLGADGLGSPTAGNGLDAGEDGE